MRILPGPETQNSRILEELLRCPNEWIAMPHLARIGSGKSRGFCMVHSRMADLRKSGYVIEHKQQREGRDTFSYYRIVVSELTLFGEVA